MVYDPFFLGKEVASSADGRFDGKMRREQSDSLQRHRRDGFAAEYDEPEDPLCTHKIGNANHLVPGFPGKAPDRLEGQASTAAVSHESRSKRHLDAFKELPYLWLGETKH